MKAFLLSVLVGTLAIASCKSRETNTNNPASTSASQVDATTGAAPKPQKPCLNLNVATTEELINLPGVGEVMARKLIAYREQHGRLRRPEEIIIIEGFSERKYRAISELICTD